MAGKAKNTAAISLGIMSAGYLGTLPFQDHLSGTLLQGAFEAGLVGGLADWFAVTALFRHPLGLPIPHTALLPKNREKLANALVAAVENNLLNKKSISDKIAQLRLGELLLDHLAKEIHTDTVKTTIDYLCKHLISNFSMEPILPFLEKEIKRQLGLFDIPIDSIIREVISKAYDEKTLDFVLDRAEQWVLKPETGIQIGRMAMQAISGLQLNGLMQFALNAFLGYLSEDKLGALLQQFAFSKIDELRTKGHPNRDAMIARLRAELNKLSSNPHIQQGLNEWKSQMLEAWRPMDQLAQTIEGFRETVHAAMSDGLYVENLVLPQLVRWIEKLQEDKDRLGVWEEWIKERLIQLLEKNHSRIGSLIRENIDRMDNRTLIAMMEEHVGKDLQWIRVNGALCGFIIGLVLTGIRLLTG